jgi:hypothetical protein
MKNIKNIKWGLVLAIFMLFMGFKTYAHIKITNDGLTSASNGAIFAGNNALVDKLAANKTFEAIYMYSFRIAICKGLNDLSRSKDQLTIQDEKLEKITANSGKFTDEDKQNMSDAIGFSSVAVFNSFNESIDLLKNSLFTELPELNSLSIIDLNETVNLAIVKAELSQKAIMLFDARDDCFERAAKDKFKCFSQNSWWNAAYIAGGLACFTAGATLTFMTSGIDGLVVPALGGIFLGCATTFAGFFGMSSRTACYAGFDSDTAFCNSRYGGPPSYAGDAAGN